MTEKMQKLTDMDDTMEQIILVCFDEGTKAAYQKAFAELTA